MTADETRRAQPAWEMQAWAEFWAAWLAWMTRQMAEDRMPLSGDVTQWIRTWGEAVGQVGFLNVNYAGSSDPQAEQRIGSRYSYGRQLGRMMDVLVPYVRKHEADFRNDPDGRAVKDFLEMAEDIDALKQASVDELLHRVKQWRKSSEFKTKLEQLKRGLEALDDTP
ncbi:hypothetical protein [Cupriavidus pauculus]|uniref:hypothetical protein n=1 Tax=Cupriavidus pauculus TaxID=82633 RepID=UPI001EE31337|nr:hypothetical protein [Cupriavidus pauculus]GJG98471.1 hypothetical protein CBA19C6_28300 [Cupriavidus pauculus]